MFKDFEVGQRQALELEGAFRLRCIAPSRVLDGLERGFDWCGSRLEAREVVWSSGQQVGSQTILRGFLKELRVLERHDHVRVAGVALRAASLEERHDAKSRERGGDKAKPTGDIRF